MVVFSGGTEVFSIENAREALWGERVLLLVVACLLDRLLHCMCFPQLIGPVM